MDASSRSIEARVADLERAVRALEARLAQSAESSEFRVQSSESEAAEDQPAAFDPVAVLTLLGRTLVLLGGAYLLRAITDAGMVAVPVGVALGFGYASIWLIAALRAARAGQTGSAIGYGTTSSMMALPLLFEAVVRFAILDGAAAAIALTVIAGAVLAVAVFTRLQPLAWIITCGAAAASLTLAVATGLVLPFAIVDIALGIATLWIGYTLDWIWLRWLPAFVADVAVLALMLVAGHPEISSPWAIIATELLLFAAYFASIAVRTLVREREVNVFETLQGTAALGAGFGGAVYVTATTGSGDALLIAIGLVCAAAAYAVAFAFVARRQGLGRNYYFYTSIALVLVLASTASVPSWSVPALAALAILASWTAARTGHVPLAVHGAVYEIAAAAQSGLIAASAMALLRTPAPASLSPLLVGVFAAGCACWGAAPAHGPSPALVRVPRLAVALLLTSSAAAAGVAIAATFSIDAGGIATVRTAAIALAALGMAALGRWPRFLEAGWLVYPLLVAGGIKLVVEDLPRSRPATMFVALGVYGIALIAAPRIARRRT